MPNRKTLLLLGRAFLLLTTTLATASVSSCVRFAPRGYGQSSGEMLVANSPERVAARGRVHDILDAATDTYIGRLLLERDSTIERWPNDGQPINVWIDSSATIAGKQALFPQAVRAAFAAWSETGIPVQFVFVNSARNADVRVRWTNHLDHKTGSTTWRTDRTGWLLSGDITLATHISDGHVLDERGMRAIALHEVGHALGLSHSTDVHDIMAPLVRVDGLSNADRETIRLLYSLNAGRLP